MENSKEIKLATDSLKFFEVVDVYWKESGAAVEEVLH